MSIKKNISPSVDEAKLRIELYNKLCMNLKGLKRDEVRTVLANVESFLGFLGNYHEMGDKIFLRYVPCANDVFYYLYKTKQLDREDGFDPEIRKHVEDVITTIYKDHDAD